MRSFAPGRPTASCWRARCCATPTGRKPPQTSWVTRFHGQSNTSAPLRPGPASAYDPDSRREFAIDAPWLDAAQADIAEGMAALQRSFDEPTPEPWRQYAARKFDKAFTEIATKKAL